MYIIAGISSKGGIGFQNSLPWRLPMDMKFFSTVTKTSDVMGKRNAVLMGRRTFESLPPNFKPLPDRLNVVVSKTMEKQCSEHIIVHDDINSVMDLLKSNESINKIFVIGGATLYNWALNTDEVQGIYLTRVTGDIECDVFVPRFLELEKEGFEAVAVSKTYSSSKHSFDFIEFKKNQTSMGETLSGYLKKLSNTSEDTKQCLRAVPSVLNRDHQEFQYLDIIADIINNGLKQNDRTGVGTLAKFGYIMRFDLSDSFPLFTTKNVYWKGVLEELLWFIKGDTNAALLAKKNVKIWDKNGSREFLDSRGLHDNEVGDLGPVYGFQWRHFGAQYVNMNTDYTGKGIDQLKNCIDLIKTDPTSRRIIMSAWNVADLNKMALPPCHILCQFFISENKLSCLLYQRSCDMGLGVPFNVASYSLLCCMMAQVCDLKPGEFIHVLGNAHVYLNHVEPLKKQLKNCPRPFPLLQIDPSIKDIDDFETKHFVIKGYNPHPRIPMEMAV